MMLPIILLLCSIHVLSVNKRIRRAATRGKTYKTSILSGFCAIERGGGSGGMPVMWQPLWRSCLPEIYRGGIVRLYISQRLQTQN